MRTIFAVAAAAAMGCLASGAQAQTYPGKPVRIVVGQAAGGGVDTLARLMAQKMAQGMGQPVVVENKPGAGGIIGTTFVTRAPPDGYTLLVAPIGNVVFNEILYPKSPYSARRDLTPIGMLATFPLILVVNGSQPYRTVEELVAHLKANPGKADYGGSGPAFQFATELFLIKTGTRAQFIQYKSTSEVLMALIAGDLLLALADTGPAHELASGGRLRALAVTSPLRLSFLPDVPTMAEIGLPELEIQFWVGVFAPAGTPQPIVKALEAELTRFVALPEVARRMAAMQVSPAAGGSEALAKVLAADLARWSAVAREANIAPKD
jgi:tripartite-type tricarboxylate transporter receptor subunit TctC